MMKNMLSSYTYIILQLKRTNGQYVVFLLAIVWSLKHTYIHTISVLLCEANIMDIMLWEVVLKNKTNK